MPAPTAALAPDPSAVTELLIENKYVLTDADVNGYNMTAAMLEATNTPYCSTKTAR